VPRAGTLEQSAVRPIARRFATAAGAHMRPAAK